MQKRKRTPRGNATIEFTLVGIPLVFVLISTVEMARGMWIYHTLAYAVKEGTRYAVGRGQNNSSANHATYQSVCNAIAQAGTGLFPGDLTLTFHSATASDVICTADGVGCPSGPWPPGAAASSIDDQQGQAISIAGFYPFVSAISMFWPGAGPGMTFTPPPPQAVCSHKPGFCLPASSQDIMQF
jgi:hypothetical protein